MKPIQHLDALKNNAKTFATAEHFKQGFVAIGWGNCFNERYNIPREELYCMDGGNLNNDKAGNVRAVMYYVTNQFFETHIMNTPITNSISEHVRIAEQYLSKSVMGSIHNKAFLPDSIRVCNRHSDNTFLLSSDKFRVREIGWVVVLESVNDYVNIVDVKEVKSFKLNDDYTATIEGDNVHIGCQTFTKELILKFAEFLKEQ